MIDDDVLGPEPEDEKPKKPERKKGTPGCDPSNPNHKKPGPKPGSRNRLKAPQSNKKTADVPKTQREVFGGVTVNFLSALFRMKAATVQRRLGDCEVLRYEGKSPIYALNVAAKYLVEPQVDLREFFRTLRKDELPARLQNDVWDAELKRQKWLIQAGELWFTEDVLEAIGEVFKTIKNTARLWQDSIDNIDSLTDRQREALSISVDGLLNELYQQITDQKFAGIISSQAEQVDDKGLPIPREMASDSDA